MVGQNRAWGWPPYPVALPSHDPADRVFGETYKLLNPDLVFEVLDDYEACTPDWPEPHEYLLRPVEVTLEDEQTVDAACYLYTWDVSTARHIPSGRYGDATQ